MGLPGTKARPRRVWSCILASLAQVLLLWSRPRHSTCNQPPTPSPTLDSTFTLPPPALASSPTDSCDSLRTQELSSLIYHKTPDSVTAAECGFHAMEHRREPLLCPGTAQAHLLVACHLEPFPSHLCKGTHAF